MNLGPNDFPTTFYGAANFIFDYVPFPIAAVWFIRQTSQFKQLCAQLSSLVQMLFCSSSLPLIVFTILFKNTYLHEILYYKIYTIFIVCPAHSRVLKGAEHFVTPRFLALNRPCVKSPRATKLRGNTINSIPHSLTSKPQ